MLKHQLRLGGSLALLLTLTAGSSVAQQAQPAPTAKSDVQCGGQYECVEDRPMTPGEAQASRSHPVNAESQDPKQVASSRPTVAKRPVDDKREGTSAP
jgi:uncharacterized membrane protein